MPKQVVQFVNKTKASPKKKVSGISGSNRDSGFIRLNAAVPPKVVQAPQENNPFGQEVHAVFDPPPEFAVRDHGNVGLKQKIVEIVKEKIAKQPAVQELLGGGDLLGDEENPMSDPFTLKYTKPKGKMCICGRLVKNCGPLLYQCCKCDKMFCASYVGRNRDGMSVHVKDGGCSSSECGPVILVRKNSVSQIKIKTS